MLACTSTMEDMEVMAIEERVYTSRFLVQYFDGCGYLLVENLEGIDNNRLLKPINLPEEYRQEGMSVDVTFRHSLLRNECNCSGISIEIDRIMETPEGIESRITGGSNVLIRNHPWQVHFTIWGRPFCGGTIIAPNFILTADHCFRNTYHPETGAPFTVNDLLAHVGITCRSEINSSNTFEVYRIIRHPQAPGRDVMLIQLSNPISFTSNRHAVNFMASTNSGLFNTGSRVTATGWGGTVVGLANRYNVMANCLQAVDLTITGLSSQLITATGTQGVRQGLCYGDSGGPLTIRTASNEPILIGVARDIASAGCGGTNQTNWSRFERVDQIVPWIDATIRTFGATISGPVTMYTNVTATFTVPSLPLGQAITWSHSTNLRRISPAIADVATFEVVNPNVREGWVGATLMGLDVFLRHTVYIINQTDALDSGVIINGTRWATRNVNTPGTFVVRPQDHGRLYQWGTFIDGSTHHWPNTGAVTGWSSFDTRAPWTSVNNPCPTGWRLPTEQELRSLGSGTWVANWSNTGVAGQVFGTSPNQIFLPAAGVRNPNGLMFSTVGGAGQYWSSTHSGATTSSGMAASLRFSNGEGPPGLIGSFNRAFAKSIRCVAE